MKPIAHFNGTEVLFSFNGDAYASSPYRPGREVMVSSGKHGVAPLRDAAGTDINVEWPESAADAGVTFATAISAELIADETIYQDRLLEMKKESGLPLPYVPKPKIRGVGKDENGLPNLSGTEKQIAWALKIRDAYAAKHPGDAAIKRGKTAKYWIDNHRDIAGARR